jgi:hypothetical protein
MRGVWLRGPWGALGSRGKWGDVAGRAQGKRPEVEDGSDLRVLPIGSK